MDNDKKRVEFKDWLENSEFIFPQQTGGQVTPVFAADPTGKESKEPKVKGTKDIGIRDVGVASPTGEQVIQPKISSPDKQTVATKNQKSYVGGDEVDVHTPKQTNKKPTKPKIFEHMNMEDLLENVDMFAKGIFSVNLSPTDGIIENPIYTK